MAKVAHGDEITCNRKQVEPVHALLADQIKRKDYQSALNAYKTAYEICRSPKYLLEISKIQYFQMRDSKAALSAYDAYLTANAPRAPANLAFDELMKGERQRLSAAVIAPPMPSREGRQPLQKKWWLWTMVGGVAAGIMIGLVAALAPRSEMNEPVMIIRDPKQYPNAIVVNF